MSNFSSTMYRPHAIVSISRLGVMIAAEMDKERKSHVPKSFDFFPDPFDLRLGLTRQVRGGG